MKPQKTTSKVSSLQLYSMLRDLEDRLMLEGNTADAFIVGQERCKVFMRVAEELTPDSGVIEADAIGMILEEEEKANEVEYLFGGDRSIDWGNF